MGSTTSAVGYEGRSLGLLVLLAVALLLAPGAAGAQPKEHEVKAVCPLNLARFVEWPEGSFSSPGDPIVLAVAGEDPFDGALERIEAPLILTVDEGRDFRRRGAISFLIEDRRVQIAVNLGVVADARPHVSSKLLALARVGRTRDSGRR
jgi:hypothetical protein